MDRYRFDIERSTDGYNYKVISSMNSHGNTQAMLNTYSYTDPDAVNGTSYYRVKMVSVTNRSKFSRIISISPSSNLLAISSAINPFSTQLDFYVNAPQAISVAEAELLDMFGRPVKHLKNNLISGNNHLQFTNTDALPAGTYTLRVRAGNIIMTKSVVKLRN
jgi:hypothetical protein